MTDHPTCGSFSLHFVRMSLFWLHIRLRENPSSQDNTLLLGHNSYFSLESTSCLSSLYTCEIKFRYVPHVTDSWNCCSTFSCFQLLFSTRIIGVSLEYACFRDPAKIWRKFMCIFGVLPIAPSFWDFDLLTRSEIANQYNHVFWVLAISYCMDS